LEAPKARSLNRACDEVPPLSDAERSISGPTTVRQFKDYEAVEHGDDISNGVGSVILALIETSGL
jgi:hypothetical protein